MTKSDLIGSLTQVLSTRKEAKDAVEKLFEEMKHSLREGNKVVISGFGSFRPFTAKPKKGRNPKTGVPVDIGPRKKVRFRAGKDLLA